MRERFALISILIILSLVFVTPLFAQDFEDLISKYTEENGQGYMRPLADAFGGSLNSGLFSTARIPKMGFHLRIGVEAMAAFVADKQKTFDATTPEYFFPETTVEAPTIFGDIEAQEVAGEGGTTYLFPGGMNVKLLPIAVPQLTVGSVFGTEAVIRWFQFDMGDDFGEIKLLGYGLRHSISQYLPSILPVDLSAGVFIQSFKVADIVDANTFFAGIQASWRASILTLYGGLGYESAKMDIAFTVGEGENEEEIAYNLKSDNSFRFTVGFALQLFILRIHADYNMGYQNVACAGVSFGM